MINPRQYFPLGKAHGNAFCNRLKETQSLAGNIEGRKHTFIVAPRRYGKSSLCDHVERSSLISWAMLDFHLAVTEKEVERIIINGVIELIGQAIGSFDKFTAIFKKYTRLLRPKFAVGTQNFHLELEVIDHTRPAENISEALLLLEKLLIEQNKQAVILFDEFQEIGLLKEGKALEGAIRHVAQETTALSFIFSGSCPHMLRAMFEDERRPLYKLCRKIVLDRIDSEHYKKHLNRAAKAKWSVELPDEVFLSIMQISERHPYYINYLCDVLWSECDKVPTIENVKNAWFEVVEEERSDLLRDFFRLTENQRKVLIYIAQNSGKSLHSVEVAKVTDMAVSSISRVLTSLVEQDYIEKVDDVYRFIVPLYTVLLQKS